MGSKPDDKLKRIAQGGWGQYALWVFLLLIFVVQLIGPTIDSPLVRLTATLFFSLFIIAGIFRISPRPAVRWFTGLLAMTAIVLRWLGLAMPTSAIIGWGLALSLIFLGILTLASINVVFRDDRPVTVSRVTGAVAVYLLFGLTWAYLYGLLDQLLPGSFSLEAPVTTDDPGRVASFTYFSFVTLTTLGYGDITPVHPLARMCVVLQALFGQLYPATLLARLVSLEITHRQAAPIPDEKHP